MQVGRLHMQKSESFKAYIHVAACYLLQSFREPYVWPTAQEHLLRSVSLMQGTGTCFTFVSRHMQALQSPLQLLIWQQCFLSCSTDA